MNSTYGKFGPGRRGYGEGEAQSASKLVQCRPGAFPGQIICSPARSGPVPIDPETGLPLPQAPLAMYDAVKYGRWGRWGGSRWGATVTASSARTTTASPVVSSISSTYTSPSYSTSVSAPSSSGSSYVTSVSPSGATAYTSVPSYVASSPTLTNAVVVPSTSSIVQTTGSGDAPYVASSTPTPSSSYFNPSSSSMWNPGGWGPMQAEGQLQMREGEDGPGNFDEDDDEDGGGDDGGGDDSGFPNERQRRRRPGRGYPANKRRRARRRRRSRRNYHGFGAYVALYGADDPWYGSKMRYTDKQGKGGYTYRQYVNGDIAIMRAPVALTDTFWPAPVGGKSPTRQWAAITKEIGATSPTYAALAASYKGTKSAKSTASQVPTSVVVTGKKNQWIDNLFSAIGSGSSSDGKKLVAQAAIQHGPEVAASASEFLAEKNSSPAAIQKKIDRKTKKLAAAKAKHDKVKVAKLTADIKGLQARLLAAQSDVEGLDAGEMATTSTFPWKYVLGGGVGLVLIAVLARSMAR